jgi:CHAT domain-containing protein
MPSFLAGCLLILSCAAVCAGQETEDVQDLAEGHSVSVLLTPEHGATLRLVLKGSEAEEIFLDAAVPDISYRMVANDGTEIRSGHLATFGWTAIVMAVAQRREFQIQLKTQSGAEGLPGVRVRAELRPIPLKALVENQRAARAFNAAQPLHRSLHAEDLRQAIGQFEQSAQEWARAGDLYGEALALGGKGESEIELSRYGGAKQSLDRALVLAGKNVYLRGWLLHLASRVLLDQWLGKQAKGFAEEELHLGQEIGDAALIAMARTDLACVAFWLRDPKMDQIADQARDEAIAAGTPETLAWDLYWKGWGEQDELLAVTPTRVLNDSEANFRRTGDVRNAWLAVQDIAQTITDKGDFYSALAAFSKLDPVFAASGNAVEYNTNLYCIGQQYERLNRPKLAAMYYRRADAAFARAHILFGRLVNHRELCETEISSNETEKAVQDCKLSLAFAQQFDDETFLGIALYDVGLAERSAGAPARALADFREAVRHGHLLTYQSKEHIQLGELLDQEGNRQDALAEFAQAESLSQGVADPASLMEAQFAVARWYARDGQLARANEELAPAFEKLEAARKLVSSSTLQASYFAAKRKCYELAVELQMRLFERDPSGGADAVALEMSERSRARGLLDALNARAGSGVREGGEAEAHLIHARLTVDRAFNHRLKLLVDGGAKRDLEANSAELMQALGNLERSEDDVHADASRETKPAATMSAAEIERASLDSGATFFEYALGAERSFLWVIGSGKVKSYVLPPRERLEEMVKRWLALAAGQERSGANARGKLQRLSARLSCALFADAVQPGMTQMVIVPDGELAILPFAVLSENGCSTAPGEPLVVGHEITLTPSLSVFLSSKPEAENESFQGEVAIVADPVFDAADPRAAFLKAGAHKYDSRPVPYAESTATLPRLVSAGDEASAIQDTVRKAGNGRVFLAQGFDASVDTVLSPALRDYRIWHLATHGVYDETIPEFSGLVFSLLGPDGSPRFGFLKAHDIARLNVRAHLVVLSACDSAAGENFNGEGAMGLSYAFLHAGAKQVISTLWSVDDANSRKLMIAFYRRFMRNGRNAAEALRQSQIKLMRDPATSAPYYWAGFTLTTAAAKGAN